MTNEANENVLTELIGTEVVCVFEEGERGLQTKIGILKAVDENYILLKVPQTEKIYAITHKSIIKLRQHEGGRR